MAANPSVVDYLNNLGKSSDLTSRAALAHSYGLVASPSDYISSAATGSNGDINTQLLAKLQTGASAPTPPAPAATSATPAATPTVRRYTGDAAPSTPGASIDVYGTYTGPGGIKANGTPSQLAAIYGGSPADYAYAAPDEATIRANALNAVQGQLDATNNTYADLMTNRGVVDQNNLGKTRAVNARSGNLGSDFGAANEAATQKSNEQADKALADERDLKIQTILGQVNTDAEQKLKDQQALATKSAEARTTYLKDLGDRAQAQIKQLAQSGASLEDLSDSEYNHLVETTGYTPEQLKAEFVLNKPKQDILHSEVVGSNYIQVSQDPISKKTQTNVIPLGVDIPQGYKVEKLENGQLVFYPDKFDPSKSVASQIITYGAATGPSDGIKFTFTSTQKSKLLGLGFDPSSISGLETYLKTNSVDNAIAAMSANGKPLPAEQIAQLKGILSGTSDDSGA